jgi:hypothetical protein
MTGRPEVNSTNLYGYADVGRFGLGHSMLAWARCVVWCDAVGAKRVAPIWLRPRIGPYLRRERDKRFYAKLFQAGTQISGFRRLGLFMKAKRISAAQHLPDADFRPQNATMVVFENAHGGNEQKYFHHIVGKSDVVRTALIDMTRTRYLPRPTTEAHFAMHIRGGDFGSPATVEELKSGRHNLKLPMDWYSAMLSGVRERLGQDVPTIVYSDCSDEEIASVLTLPNVTRSTYDAAVTDMLAMSQASLLISSASGFSRWGSYLGQVPRICFPGQRAVRTLGQSNGVDFEPEANTAADLEKKFISKIATQLSVVSGGPK